MHLGGVVPNDSMARRFLSWALILGFAYAIVNPPFAVNDERSHWLRVYEMSRGHFRTRSDAQGPFHLFPSKYHDLTVQYTRIQADPRARVDLDRLWYVLMSSDRPGYWERHMATASSYNVITYLPHLPFVWLARVLGLPALWHIYLARFASVVAFAVLGSWSVAIAGTLGRVFFLLGLMPMTLTQAAGLSGDGMTNAIAFLLFALVARGSMLPAGALSRRQLLTLSGLLAALTLCKPTYLLASLAFPALRWEGAKRDLWRWLYPALSAAGAILAEGLWVFVNRSAATSGSNVLQTQLGWIIGHPLQALLVVPVTFLTCGDGYLIQFVAFRDIIHRQMRFMGGAVGALYVLLLWAVSWGASWRPRQDPAERRWSAAWFAISGFAMIGAVMFAMYLASTTTGAMAIRGVQGRYFIAIAPALLVALSGCGRPAFSRWLAAAEGRRLRVAVVVINALCLLALVGRYYASPVIPWPY
jgi:uncharacterized membrane protein